MFGKLLSTFSVFIQGYFSTQSTQLY